MSSAARALASAVALAAAALVAAGCSADPPPAPAASAEPPTTAAPHPEAPAKAPLAQTKFGAPLSPGEVTKLEQLVAQPAAFAGKTVKTEGVVKAVCKSAGCWMEIGDDAGRAHVKMAGHSFYVPKNCDGHRAVIEGKVKEGAPADECGAKDSCGGEANGALAKLEIEASGVEFLD